jgi:hypothetical protein
MFLIRYIPSFE